MGWGGLAGWAAFSSVVLLVLVLVSVVLGFLQFSGPVGSLGGDLLLNFRILSNKLRLGKGLAGFVLFVVLSVVSSWGLLLGGVGGGWLIGDVGWA